MPRRKFRYNQRLDPANERSFQEYLLNEPAPPTTRTELLRLIRGGEDTYLELKVKLSNNEKITQGIVALANTDGGTIIFGVNDQLRIEGVSNPEWVQQELARICREDIVPPIVPFFDCIAFDNGRRVVVLDVEGKKKPYRTRDGRFYMRFGAEKREVTREELSVWLDELRPLGYENIPLSDAVEADFDDGLLWGFANAFEDNVMGNHLYQTADFLRRDLLMAVGTVDDFIPTVAAVLLFGKNERVPELIPRSTMTVVRYSGSNGNAQLIEKIELKGNMLSVYEGAIRFVQRYCDLAKERTPRPELQEGNLPVQWRSRYHIYSIREALANALVHRDLSLRDNPTRLNIYDNSIEIINPRRTNGFATASRAIRYGITQRLNPQIAAIFSRREYGSNVPKGGLPMILRQSNKFSGKRPEIYTANDEFKLKIYGV